MRKRQCAHRLTVRSAHDSGFNSLSCRSASSVSSRISESQRTWKKGAFHLVSVSHFNSAYNLRGERILPYPSAVIFCESRRAFFRQGTRQLRERALIDSPAICTETFHARVRIRACARSPFLSAPNKRAAESWYLPFQLIDDTIITVTVSSTRRSKSNRAILLWKNNKFLLHSIFIFFFYILFHQLL